jgi:hypothetical protein
MSIRISGGRLTRRLSLVEHELLTLLEHLSSHPVFSGVRVTRSLVLYVCFVDRCLSLCAFSFSHCVVCSSSIYGFWWLLWYLHTLLSSLNGYWLPLWYLQTLLSISMDSDYPFGIFTLFSVVSMDSDYPFGIFKLFSVVSMYVFTNIK